MKKLILIDGNSLMFRAYYATAYTGNLMKSKSGVYTNALSGFVNMMSKIVEENSFSHLFVAFDTAKKTFRHEQFEDYKGGRKPMPEELGMQIPLMKDYLDIMNIKRLEIEGIEADDLIGTFSRLAYDNFDEIEIYSADRDLLQLVDKKTKMMITKRGVTELEEYTFENFLEKVGVHPNQMSDYKGLIGDSSDNIPGVRGIGPKTAAKLLEQYQTLENIIDHIDQLTGKTKEYILQDQEIAKMSKQLATIKCDVEMSVSLDDTYYKGYKIDELIRFFEQYDFHSFIKKLEKGRAAEETTIKNSNYKKQTILNLINDISADDIGWNENCYIMIEAVGENYHLANILGIMLLMNEKAYYLYGAALQSVKLKTYLEDATYEKKTFDYKRTHVLLKRLGITLNHVSFDLLLASYIINPSYAKDEMRETVFNFGENELPYEENVYGKGSKFILPEVESIAKFAMQKVEVIRKLEPTLLEQIKENNQESLFFDLEIPLSRVLAEMEITGFCVDQKELDRIGSLLEIKIDEFQRKIYDIALETFNIDSVKQLGYILFEKLNLPKGKKTKTGYSTGVEVLESLSHRYDIAKYILEYRKYAKLYNTYVKGLRLVIHEDGKVHTIFKQTVAATGRLSSIEPNLQNIPIRTEEGKIIRGVFVPQFPDGYIVSADYSQIELRILADMGNVKKMQEAFRSHLDFHTTTAMEIYGVSLDQVTKEMRRTAKAVNFGIIYGMSDWGLSENIGISPTEANIFIKKYFTTFPEVKDFLDKVVNDAKQTGYTETIFHRRRYIPELKNSNFNVQKFGERTAMNAPIQGSAADIIKKAMVDVAKILEQKNLKSKMIVQVHDELVFDVPKDELEIVKAIVKDTMEQAVTLSVPLEVETEYGKNWNLK
jgi:DNA polymerase I